MKFDPFVIPFSIGLLLLFIVVLVKFSKWISLLSSRDRYRFNKGIFSFKIFGILKEIILESLFHRRIFKVNKLLGYMHMSFAFGWFMLIVIGNIESRLYTGLEFNLPYYPIFFKFFVHQKPDIIFSNGFTFLMDFFLLLVLSGFVLAISKRIYSGLFKMKKTSKIRKYDKIAMYSLWLIFPLRLIAESYAAAMYNTGGFLTQTIGNLLVNTPDIEKVSYFFWWAYSIDLGLFFIMLPYSRYMHIPAEILLIAFRRFGIGISKKYNCLKDLEVNACPMCGLCIDACQLQIQGDIKDTQSVYFIKSIRNRKVDNNISNYCSICGRCKQVCPVKIDTDSLRISQRTIKNKTHLSSFNYINDNNNTPKADVIYFAGCMSHLTPGITKSMELILNKANVNYYFADKDGSICCGRPLLLGGLLDDAENLININKKIFTDSGATLLVTSCPICYRSFKEDYRLGIEVMHHTEYLNELINQGKLNVSKNDLNLVYHDPCELGRGSGIYDQPRAILNKIGYLQEIKNSKENALCCGGSIANLQIRSATRNAISLTLINEFNNYNPDKIVTSCPLCKKTLSSQSKTEVIDISEVVAKALD